MDPYFLRHNERIKTVASVLGNLGGAALAYGVGRLASGSQELLDVSSIFGACVLFYFAYAVLNELEVEV